MGADDEELLDEEEGDEYNIIAIAITVVVVLAIIGGVVWYFFLRTPPEEDVQGPQMPQWEKPENAEEELVFDLLPTMIINPADSQGRYLLIVKVDIGFNRDVRGELLGKPWILAQAQNLIIDVFSSYTISELQTPKFKEEARLEVKYELNRLLGWEGPEPTPEEAEELTPDALPPIKDLYLVKFIIQ